MFKMDWDSNYLEGLIFKEVRYTSQQQQQYGTFTIANCQSHLSSYLLYDRDFKLTKIEKKHASSNAEDGNKNVVVSNGL